MSFPIFDDYLDSSKTYHEFFRKIKENVFSEVIAKIEMVTRNQLDSSSWFSFSKGNITTSKSHEVMAKMKKVASGGRGSLNLWSSTQKVSGFIYKKSNLEYEREMEGHAAEKFKDFLSGKEIFLDKTYPFIIDSPDCKVKCACHKD